MTQARIIGNGLIARAFHEAADEIPDDVVICAAGVANSLGNDSLAFTRERDLLSSLVASSQGRCLVYFSSLSVIDHESSKHAYAVHKFNMEEIIRSVPRHVIFRLSQVVGTGGNQNTLTQNLYQRLVDGERIDIWRHAYRSLIDIDDVVRIVIATLRLKPGLAATYNVPGQWLPITRIVELMEKSSGLTGQYAYLDQGMAVQEIESSPLQPVLDSLGISFDGDYTEKLLCKYYPPVEKIRRNQIKKLKKPD